MPTHPAGDYEYTADWLDLEQQGATSGEAKARIQISRTATPLNLTLPVLD